MKTHEWQVIVRYTNSKPQIIDRVWSVEDAVQYFVAHLEISAMCEAAGGNPGRVTMARDGQPWFDTQLEAS